MNIANKEYDVALLLGGGITAAGVLPESSVASVKKAAELYRHRIVRHIATCGKWSYAAPFTPPVTEAEALCQALIAQGVPAEVIFTEAQSVSTVSNICLAKEQYFIPQQWNRILLVSVEPQSERALFNVQYVLGEGYTADCVLADFTYPPEKMRQAVEKEKARITEARRFLGTLPRGDHQAILKAATADLHKNWLPSAKKHL